MMLIDLIQYLTKSGSEQETYEQKIKLELESGEYLKREISMMQQTMLRESQDVQARTLLLILVRIFNAEIRQLIDQRHDDLIHFHTSIIESKENFKRSKDGLLLTMYPQLISVTK